MSVLSILLLSSLWVPASAVPTSGCERQADQFCQESRLQLDQLHRMAREPLGQSWFDPEAIRRENLGKEPPIPRLEASLDGKPRQFQVAPPEASFVCFEGRPQACVYWDGTFGTVDLTKEEIEAMTREEKPVNPVQSVRLDLKTDGRMLVAGTQPLAVWHQPGKGLPALTTGLVTLMAEGTCPNADDMLGLLKAVPDTAQVALALSNCKLDDGLMLSLADFGQRLVGLRLVNTDLPPGAWARIAQLKGLQSLELGGLNLSAFPAFRIVPRLRSLVITGAPDTQVGGAILRAILGSARLRYLGLHGVSISEGDLGLLFSQGPALVHLDLSGSSLSPGPFAELYLLQSLRSLSLAGTAVDDSFVMSLSRLQRLRRLDLTGTALTESGLSSVAFRATLKELALPDLAGAQTLTELLVIPELNRLSGGPLCARPEALSVLRRMAKLQHLELRGATLGRDGATWLESWAGLRLLVLGGAAPGVDAVLARNAGLVVQYRPLDKP
jgi:hypothetical protein